ncbi:hypothetical protein BD626DRAFT_576940 [Schizophyllum amplum]|uniref:Uncharacterized protein n=1 Tax=Schizophyllum amplum TaxID=97359 RepID=A0A550BSX8_9AGAR|nr:hypothetical protein BD626DRAFT_576940 [Auriculariopsis ampla]
MSAPPISGEGAQPREHAKIRYAFSSRWNSTTTTGRYGHHDEHVGYRQQQREAILDARRGGYITSEQDVDQDELQLDFSAAASGSTLRVHAPQPPPLYFPQALRPSDAHLQSVLNGDRSPVEDQSLALEMLPFRSPPTPISSDILHYPTTLQDIASFHPPPTPALCFERNSPTELPDMPPFRTPLTPSLTSESVHQMTEQDMPPLRPLSSSTQKLSSACDRLEMPPFKTPPTPSYIDPQDMPPFRPPPTPMQELGSSTSAILLLRPQPTSYGSVSSAEISGMPPFRPPPTPTQGSCVTNTFPAFNPPPTPAPAVGPMSLQEMLPFRSPPTPTLTMAFNQALSQSQSRYISLTNNDITTPPSFLSYASGPEPSHMVDPGALPALGMQNHAQPAAYTFPNTHSGYQRGIEEDAGAMADDEDDEDVEMADATMEDATSGPAWDRDGVSQRAGKRFKVGQWQGGRYGAGGGASSNGDNGGRGAGHADAGDPNKEHTFKALLRRLQKAPDNIPVTKGDFLMFLESLQVQLQRQIRDRSPSPSPRKKANEKTRAVQHRSEEDTLLAEFVRALTRNCMGRSSTDPLQNRHLPNPDDLKYFLRTEDVTRGPNIDQLKIDIGCGGVASKWNKRAATLFVAKFSSIYNTDEVRWQDQQVHRAFMSHLKGLRKKMQHDFKAVTDPTYDGGAQARLKRRKARNYNEYHRRMKGWKLFEADDAVQPHIELWAKEHWEGFISDSWSDGEDSEPEMYYRRVRPFHRNPDLDAYFRLPALLQLSTHFQEGGRKTVGQMPHMRDCNDNPKVVHRERVPPGLPRNFYNPEYLDGLDVAQRRALNVQPVMDIKLPAYILRFASRYESIRSLRDVPERKNTKIATSLLHLGDPEELADIQDGPLWT